MKTMVPRNSVPRRKANVKCDFPVRITFIAILCLVINSTKEWDQAFKSFLITNFVERNWLKAAQTYDQWSAAESTCIRDSENMGKPIRSPCPLMIGMIRTGVKNKKKSIQLILSVTCRHFNRTPKTPQFFSHVFPWAVECNKEPSSLSLSSLVQSMISSESNETAVALKILLQGHWCEILPYKMAGSDILLSQAAYSIFFSGGASSAFLLHDPFAF